MSDLSINLAFEVIVRLEVSKTIEPTCTPQLSLLGIHSRVLPFQQLLASVNKIMVFWGKKLASEAHPKSWTV